MFKINQNLRSVAWKSRRRFTSSLWIPELHKTFVEAVDSVGGREGATPMAIKKAMGIDTLSHSQINLYLQRYRMIKPSPSRLKVFSSNVAKELRPAVYGSVISFTLPYLSVFIMGFGKKKLEAFLKEKKDEVKEKNDEVKASSFFSRWFPMLHELLLHNGSIKHEKKLSPNVKV